MTEQEVQLLIDNAKNTIKNTSETGSVIIMKKILSDLEKIYNEDDYLTQDNISKLDLLREEIDNIFKNRFALESTMCCQKDVRNAVAMAQDHIKTYSRF